MNYLKSGKEWSDLNINPELLSRLIAKGFKKPSKIQGSIISLYNKGINKDIIVQSQNGSGKTLSFVIPSFMTVLKYPNTQKNDTNILAPTVIILADTKELTYQIFKIMLNLQVKGIQIDLQHPENTEIKSNSNIVICTLGRLFYLISKKTMILDNLKLFVIDEADKLLEADSNKNKIPLILKKLKPETKINIFSATLPKQCIEFLEKLKRDFIKIILQDTQQLSLKNISNYFVKCNTNDKIEFVNNLLFKLTQGSVILFINTKKFAEKFANILTSKGHKVELLLGNMETIQRLKILDNFKNGKIRILISTNLISRGIDNRKVGLVINVDLPFLMRSAETKGNNFILDHNTYLHRVGRTGRFGDFGVAVSLIDKNYDLNNLEILKSDFGIEIKELKITEIDKINKELEKNKEYNIKKRTALEENI